QREADSLRRVDEKFVTIITNLGSDSEAIQASTTVSILSFLKPEYQQSHYQVFMTLLANLKVHHSPVIHKLLLKSFVKAFQLHYPLLKEQDKTYGLDLSSAYLYRADLSGYDLSYSDLAFANLQNATLNGAETSLYRAQGIKANLESAWLSGANMQEARLREATFTEATLHGTRLVSARLEGAIMDGAQFQQASMQEAHLEKADLTGAKFEQANVANTFFAGATLDDEALKSLLNTKDKSWKKANFDSDEREKLERMERSL
ncbi:MAG: pentapeptide repeat-containing protein, partial [Proteobacteria bacterium]|nr:pentapeptide repeat-containing protein [Pseudomonadota bacterium]